MGADTNTASDGKSQKVILGLLVGFVLGALAGGYLGLRLHRDMAAEEGDLVVELESASALDQALKNEDVIVLDFHAVWCGPCRALKPRMREIADAYADRITVMAVNVDTFPDIAKKYGVRSIPDVRFFKNGVLKDGVIGLEQKQVYTDIIDSLLSEAPEQDNG